MTPMIENVGRREVETGYHKLHGDNTVLISINDPLQEPAKPHFNFRHVLRFEFLDIEDEEHDFAITDHQALELTKLLELCYVSEYNVLVHCNAGICRSGAIAEVGEMMGFDYVGKYKQPNLLVKSKLMRNLGWGYHDETS